MERGRLARRPSREVPENFSSINLEPSAEAQAKVDAARARERALEKAVKQADAEKEALLEELRTLQGSQPATPRSKPKSKKPPPVDPKVEELNAQIGALEQRRAEAKAAFLEAHKETKRHKESADAERRQAFARFQSARAMKQAAAFARAYQDAHEEVTAALDQQLREKQREKRARAWHRKRAGLPSAFRGTFEDLQPKRYARALSSPHRAFACHARTPHPTLARGTFIQPSILHRCSSLALGLLYSSSLLLH